MAGRIVTTTRKLGAGGVRGLLFLSGQTRWPFSTIRKKVVVHFCNPLFINEMRDSQVILKSDDTTDKEIGGMSPGRGIH
jgi:hypothetical protein